MATQEKTPRVYLGKCSARQMQNGAFKWINISVNLEELAKHADAKGYISLNIFERKEPDMEFGNTHSISIRQRTTDWADAVEVA